MTDKEYIEFVEEFLELFATEEQEREKIIIDSKTAKL